MEGKLLEDIFQAYFDARKNKRGTANALRFELDFETELFRLYDELVSRRYKISRSICFISFYPIKREIFAGDFRDRIIHHLIFNYLNPLCERMFINDSYSCREGRGTSYGVKRADHFIRSCSKNYKQDCYILKLDIAGYFMSIDKSVLFEKIKKIISKFEAKIDFDRGLVLWLIEMVIFHDPIKSCVIKGKREDWKGLPKSKSLFFSQNNCGLPIGNLTSQLFGNIYLNDLDHFIVYKLGCKYYGRYVDDILIIHQDKQFLKTLVPLLDGYLRDSLCLSLHRKKIYLQHFKKGVVFLGRVIKPYRMYVRNRLKGNMGRKVHALAVSLRKQRRESAEQAKSIFYDDQQKELAMRIMSCLNSYLGIMQNVSAHRLMVKFIALGTELFGEYVELVEYKKTRGGGGEVWPH